VRNRSTRPSGAPAASHTWNVPARPEPVAERCAEARSSRIPCRPRTGSADRPWPRLGRSGGPPNGAEAASPVSQPAGWGPPPQSQREGRVDQRTLAVSGDRCTARLRYREGERALAGGDGQRDPGSDRATAAGRRGCPSSSTGSPVPSGSGRATVTELPGSADPYRVAVRRGNDLQTHQRQPDVSEQPVSVAGTSCTPAATGPKLTWTAAPVLCSGTAPECRPARAVVPDP